MAEPSGRQPFRFRFPWMMNTTPVTRPLTPEPKREATRPTTSVPVQRTAERIPMPSQRRPQPQPQPPSPPKKTQPQTPQPSKSSEVVSQPEGQPQAADSLPKSPSRTRPESQAASQPPLASENKVPQKTVSQPSSPPKNTSQPQSKSTSQPQSPSRATPLQPQTPPRTESKSTAPSPAPSQSRVTSPATHSHSPSQSRVSSQPGTPSQTSPKTPSANSAVPQSAPPTTPQRLPASRVASKPSSPVRATSQPATQMSPHAPSSPSRTTSQQPSPSRQVTAASQTKGQASSQTASPAKSSMSKSKPASTYNATKTEAAFSHPLSQDPQPQVPAHQPESLQPQATSEQLMDKNKFSQILYPGFLSTPASKLAAPVIRVPQPSKPSVVPEQSTGPNKYINSAIQTKEIKEEKSQPNSSREEDKLNTIDDKESKERKRAEFSNLAVSGSNRQPQGWASEKSQRKQNHLSNKTQGEDKDIAKESKFSTTNLQKNVNASNESHSPSSVSQGELATLHKDIKEGIFGFVHKMGSRDSTELQDGPVSVVTLTGENRGATMHLGAEMTRKEGSVHINRGYKLNQEDKNEVTTDEENSSKKRKSNNTKTEEDSATTAYINSNVQSINNSIMSGSSIIERSPGIRWVMRNNHVEPANSKGKNKSVEAHKADFSATRPQKLTYEPTVRRRCLRGLLLEPSESDPENPDKPRRHGCRYTCEEKEKQKEQW